MQKYLITGGAGFIGCHLVEKLVNLGKEVLVFDNLSFGRFENIEDLSDKIRFVNGDINDYPLLEETAKEFAPDVVVHLAAIHFIPYCNAHPGETVYVNVDGTQTLLDICSNYRPQKVIFASSAAVYPPSDLAHSETGKIAGCDIYGATKMFGETLMSLFAKQSMVATVSCRLFNAYGPKETNDHVVPHIMEQLGEGKTAIKLGNINPKRDYIYVTDVADALLAISTYDVNKYETFNIGTGLEYSVKELVQEIDSILNRGITIDSVSEFKRKSDRPHLCSDIRKIQSIIGWTPKYNISTGLAELISALSL